MAANAHLKIPGKEKKLVVIILCALFQQIILTEYAQCLKLFMTQLHILD